MEILVPIGVCVVLPIVLVWLISRVKINAQNKRSQLLMEAIKLNPHLDMEKLVESLAKPKLSPRETNNRRLLAGLICALVSLAFFGGAALEAHNGDTDHLGDYCIFGGILLAVGIAYLVVYFVARKQITEE